jgi:SAM-dependent methyltransferase
VSAFRRLDDAADQHAFFVNVVDLWHATPAVRANHLRTFALLDAAPGGRFLDVGCGTGDYARELAELVGPTGHVTAIDASAAMVEVARGRAEGTGLPVSFQVADAQALPFPEASFDGCRAERVLQYLDDPDAALREMVRVVRPGGRVVATEPDWDCLICDLPGIDCDIWRRAVAAIGDDAGNAWMGRELHRRFRAAGVVDVAIEPTALILTDASVLLDQAGARRSIEKACALGAISRAETDMLFSTMLASSEQGDFFFAQGCFTASGTTPA